MKRKYIVMQNDTVINVDDISRYYFQATQTTPYIRITFTGSDNIIGYSFPTNLPITIWEQAVLHFLINDESVFYVKAHYNKLLEEHKRLLNEAPTQGSLLTTHIPDEPIINT